MSGRLDQVRARLQPVYRKGIPAKLGVLSTALARARRGDVDARDSLREVAHQLRGSAASYGFSAISVAAAATEQASEDDLDVTCVALIGTLKGAYDQDPSRIRVLFIDDDDELQRLALETASAMRMVVLPARSAKEARGYFETLAFDCVVLDLRLPGADGLELVDLFTRAGVPVVVLSAATGQEASRESAIPGVARVLRKPIDMEMLVVTVSTIVERSQRAAQETRVDPLTGLPNRAGFMSTFDEWLAEAGSEVASLAMIDLDRFEKVNDEYGHDAGDQALRLAVETIEESLRERDTLARWGGEELVALLPGATKDDAASVIERARVRLGELPMELDGHVTSLRLGFSAGVVEVDETSSFEAALHAADRLLMAAKVAGRGRVLSEIPEVLPRPRILLADDDELLARAVRTVLRGRGIDLVWCADGRLALEHAAKERFALVILDGQMPKLDGFGTLEALRLLPSYRDVPIMMLTSMGKDAHVERAFAGGADDYLEKPFRPRELRERVRRMLERSGAFGRGRGSDPTPPQKPGDSQR